MRHRLVMTTLATLLTLASTQAISTAHAQPVDDPRVLLRHGETLLGDGKYVEALAELKKAREKGASFEVLYSIAKAHQKLGDPASALSALEQYLKEGGAQISGPRRNLIDRDISKLKSSMAMLEITSDPPGARVSVDGNELETPTPVTRGVLPGKHQVVFSKDGSTSVTKTVEISGNGTTQVSATLTAAKPVESAKPVATSKPPTAPASVSTAPATAPTTPTTAQSKATEPPRSSGPTQPPWAPRPPPVLSNGAIVAWVATGLLAAGTITTGALSLSAREKRDQLRNTAGAAQSDIDAQHNRATTMGIVTGALAGASVLSGGLSLYLTARTYRDSIPEYPPSIPPAPTSALIVSPTGIGWARTF